MFSGIVETQSKITFSQLETIQLETLKHEIINLENRPLENLKNSNLNLNTQKLRIRIQKPEEWSDIKRGDSIAVNGICLTVESYSETEIEFILGPETLKVIQSAKNFFSRTLNLERSLLFNSRIHGHLVLGHVDGMAKVLTSRGQNNIHFLSILLPESFAPFVWYKGSISLSGVSLTINAVKPYLNSGAVVDVCLIPETVRATNLIQYQEGDLIPFEIDNMSRGLVRQLEFNTNLKNKFVNIEVKSEEDGENNALNT